MANRKVNNYSILDSFNRFVPNVPLLIILGAFLILGALLGNVVNLILMKFGIGMETGIPNLLAYPLIFIPAMVYAGVKSANAHPDTQVEPLNRSNFAPLSTTVCILIAIIATLSASFVSEYFVTLLPEMPESLKEMLESLTKGNFFVNLVCVSIFAPFFEEWLCRGMVLRGLLKFSRRNGRKGICPVWAIVISAVFFAFLHLNPWQAIPAFALGLLFGYVYYKTGSLKLTMLMHCANNTFALIISRVPGLEDIDSFKDILEPRLYWIIFACCAVIVALSIVSFRKIVPDAEQPAQEQ